MHQKIITIKLQTKKAWNSTFVRHFWLPLVKTENRWLLAAAGFVNHIPMWALASLGPKSQHSHWDYVKIRTDSHQVDIYLHRQYIVENAKVYSLDWEANRKQKWHTCAVQIPSNDPTKIPPPGIPWMIIFTRNLPRKCSKSHTNTIPSKNTALVFRFAISAKNVVAFTQSCQIWRVSSTDV